MGIGLGEITPINLQLTRENFNALIGRHGQSVRWLMSEKCSCIDKYQNVDANCEICKGKGVNYTTQTESIRVEILTAPIDGIIEQENVIEVKDLTGKIYPITESNCVTYVNGVLKGQKYQVKYIEDVSKTKNGTAGYMADKLYKIDLQIESTFGDIQGSLLSVTATFNNTPLTVKEIFRNCFEIEESLNHGDVVEYICTYIEPFIFALTQNNQTEEDRKFLSDVGGTALLTFPQRWTIYEEDVIVSLNGTLAKKEVIFSSGDIDNLPSFYPAELISASVIREKKKVSFEPNIDFIIYKGSQIKWITENKPEDEEKLSISYTYNPTYKVLGEMPSPRTSENNRFPRKVALKVYTDYNSREDF